MKFGEKITNTLIPEWKEFYLNYELLKDTLQLALKRYPLDAAKGIKGFKVELCNSKWPLFVISAVKLVDPKTGREYQFSVKTTEAGQFDFEMHNLRPLEEGGGSRAPSSTHSISPKAEGAIGSASINMVDGADSSIPTLESSQIVKGKFNRRVSSIHMKVTRGGEAAAAAGGGDKDPLPNSGRSEGRRTATPGVIESSPASFRAAWNTPGLASLERVESRSGTQTPHDAECVNPTDIYPQFLEVIENLQTINNIVGQALSLEMEKVTQFYRRQSQLVCSAVCVCIDAAKRLDSLTRSERASLRVAFRQVYYSLDKHQQFCDLNVIAVGKLLKKFGKNTFQTTLTTFQQNIDNLPFSAVFEGKPTIQNLKEEMFNYYADYVMGGSKKEAREALYLKDRADQLREGQPLLFSLGLLIGICVSLVILLIQEAAVVDIGNAIPNLHNAPYLLATTFAFLLLPILFAVNVMAWESHGINYAFVFDLDPTRHWNGMELFRNNLLYFLIWLTCSYATLKSSREELQCGGSHSEIPAWLWPYFVFPLCLIAKILLSAFDHRQAWFLPSVGRVLLSPMWSVQFSDFFIADQMTSVSSAMFNLQFFWCYFDAKGDIEGICRDGISMGVFGIAILPVVWRLIQCLRRYYDMDVRAPFPHLVNAGKYTSYTCSGLSAFFLSYARHHKAEVPVMNTALAFYFICHVASTCYGCTWDAIMDSGIVQVNRVKNFGAVGGNSGSGGMNGSSAEVTSPTTAKRDVPFPIVPSVVPGQQASEKLVDHGEQLTILNRNTKSNSVSGGNGSTTDSPATAGGDRPSSATQSQTSHDGGDSNYDENHHHEESHSIKFSIRRNILYGSMGYYYMFLIVNPLIRLGWLVAFIVGALRPESKSYKFIVFAVIGILRRFIWNFFRVENEQVNNYENYRATKFVPVPTRSLEVEVETPEDVYNRFKQVQKETQDAGPLDEEKRRERHGVELAEWSFLTKFFANLPSVEKRIILRNLMVDVKEGPLLKRITRFKGYQGEGKSAFFASLPEPIKAHLVLSQIGSMTLAQYAAAQVAKAEEENDQKGFQEDPMISICLTPEQSGIVLPRSAILSDAGSSLVANPLNPAGGEPRERSLLSVKSRPFEDNEEEYQHTNPMWPPPPATIPEEERPQGDGQDAATEEAGAPPAVGGAVEVTAEPAVHTPPEEQEDPVE